MTPVVGMIVAVVVGAGAELVALPAAPATVAVPVGSATAPSPTRPPTVAASAAEMLAEQVAADRSVAESLVDRWVPQIGSKAVGTAVGGTVYDEELIWEQYRAARSAFPAAVLVRSDDYTSFRRTGYWVVLVAAPQPSADAVNLWCASTGLTRDDCFAKRLSHTDGPEGNTKQR